MDRPDIKTICGAGFGSPEVQEIMLRELRARDTSIAVWGLPDMAHFARQLPPRLTSGLVEWYRILGAKGHA